MDMRKRMAMGFDDYVDGDEDAGKGNDKDDKDKVVFIKSGMLVVFVLFESTALFVSSLLHHERNHRTLIF